jgi:hypothetical protein
MKGSDLSRRMLANCTIPGKAKLLKHAIFLQRVLFNVRESRANRLLTEGL